MFIAALFAIAGKQKQSKCSILWTDNENMVYISTEVHFNCKEKLKQSFKKWVELENIPSNSKTNATFVDISSEYLDISGNLISH